MSFNFTDEINEIERRIVVLQEEIGSDRMKVVRGMYAALNVTINQIEELKTIIITKNEVPMEERVK